MMASVLARRPVRLNPSARSWRTPAPPPPTDLVITAFEFHRGLPGYSPTGLLSLDQVAKDAGVKAVYVKNEGQRLGLQSFKILGASWGAFRAVVQRLDLPRETTLDAAKQALLEKALWSRWLMDRTMTQSRLLLPKLRSCMAF